MSSLTFLWFIFLPQSTVVLGRSLSNRGRKIAVTNLIADARNPAIISSWTGREGVREMLKNLRIGISNWLVLKEDAEDPTCAQGQIRVLAAWRIPPPIRDHRQPVLR